MMFPRFRISVYAVFILVAWFNSCHELKAFKSDEFQLLAKGNGRSLYILDHMVSADVNANVKADVSANGNADNETGAQIRNFEVFTLNGRKSVYFAYLHGPLTLVDELSEVQLNAVRTDWAQKRPVNFETNSYREIMGYDPATGFIAHKHELGFIRAKIKPGTNNRDQQKTFVPLNHDISRSRLFTSSAADGKNLYAGTAVNGLYFARNGAANAEKGYRIKFDRINAGLPYKSHDKKIKLYEEIRTIAVSGGALCVGLGIETGVYCKYIQDKSFKALKLPKESPLYSDVVKISFSKDGNAIWVSTTAGLIVYRHDGKARKDFTEYRPEFISWKEFLQKFGTSNSFLYITSPVDDHLQAMYISREELDSNKAGRVKQSAGRKLFYTSANSFTEKKSSIINILKRENYNGVVIDVKDDFGYVRYHSGIKFLKQIGAVRSAIDLKSFIQEVKKLKKYVVARIVVFKDPVLYKQKGYAILDKNTNKPWVGAPGERWVDPYNADIARNYYIPMVKELQELGVDEIQLDYIRFPSDGGVHRCKFSHNVSGLYQSEAMENFLYALRSEISIPLGVDIYGYNGLYRASGVIGQDIEAFGRHVDVISPMLYSSHFGNSYMVHLPKDERTYALIKLSVSRGMFIANGRFQIRPYLQGFPMRNDVWGYGKQYFLDQIQATADSGVTGFSFWGSLEHMKQVEPAIAEYNKKAN